MDFIGLCVDLYLIYCVFGQISVTIPDFCPSYEAGKVFKSLQWWETLFKRE